METKQQIRKRHLMERNLLSDNIAAQCSLKICRKLQEYFCQNKKYQVIGVYGYYPHGKEVSLLELYAWLLKQNVPLAFPRVSGDTMEFFRIASMKDFQEGAFCIMEPKQSCKQADFTQAACLVPGSVFDDEGNRYGYGKGYYDRYFSVHMELYRIGIAYEGQVERRIPFEENDIKMQALATENGLRFLEK